MTHYSNLGATPSAESRGKSWSPDVSIVGGHDAHLEYAASKDSDYSGSSASCDSSGVQEDETCVRERTQSRKDDRVPIEASTFGSSLGLYGRYDERNFVGLDQLVPIFTVIDTDARIRTGPPNFRWRYPRRIPQYTRVQILDESSKYVFVEGLRGKKLGWTVRSNLGTFFKDTEDDDALAPEAPIDIRQNWSPERKALARTYNRLGGLLGDVATSTRVETEACLAVWQVESSGRRHTPGRATIRFENHHFFLRWGDRHVAVYNRHFRHGGHNGIASRPWHNHRFRTSPSGAWKNVHASHSNNYQALELATDLSSERIAVQCISIGGPQILVSNYELLGYRSPSSMYKAFQEGEGAHVLGFFDYCKYAVADERLFRALRNKEWPEFAAGYNGPGNGARYSKLIGDAYEVAQGLL